MHECHGMEFQLKVEEAAIRENSKALHKEYIITSAIEYS